MVFMLRRPPGKIAITIVIGNVDQHQYAESNHDAGR